MSKNEESLTSWTIGLDIGQAMDPSVLPRFPFSILPGKRRSSKDSERTGASYSLVIMICFRLHRERGGPQSLDRFAAFLQWSPP